MKFPANAWKLSQIMYFKEIGLVFWSNHCHGIKWATSSGGAMFGRARQPYLCTCIWYPPGLQVPAPGAGRRAACRNTHRTHVATRRTDIYWMDTIISIQSIHSLLGQIPILIFFQILFSTFFFAISYTVFSQKFYQIYSVRRSIEVALMQMAGTLSGLNISNPFLMTHTRLPRHEYLHKYLQWLPALRHLMYLCSRSAVTQSFQWVISPQGSYANMDDTGITWTN